MPMHLSKKLKATSYHTADDQHRTPLHIAAARGHEAMVEFLVRKGARVDAKNEKNETPIHLAAKNGHVGYVSR